MFNLICKMFNLKWKTCIRLDFWAEKKKSLSQLIVVKGDVFVHRWQNQNLIWRSCWKERWEKKSEASRLAYRLPAPHTLLLAHSSWLYRSKLWLEQKKSIKCHTESVTIIMSWNENKDRIQCVQLHLLFANFKINET